MSPALRERDVVHLVDEVTATTCRRIIASEGARWTDWEVQEGLEDVAATRGGDCCYDRPSIGVAYALYHGPARIRDALRLVGPIFDRHREGPLRLVDLGCGTGAVACAAMIAAEVRRHQGRSVPTAVSVTGCDQSAFMTRVGAALVGELLRRLPTSPVGAEFFAVPWEEIRGTGNRTVITGAFLVDHSDDGHAPVIARRIGDLAEAIGAVEIALTTVSSKVSTIKAIARGMGGGLWTQIPTDLDRGVLGAGADLDETRALRHEWYSEHGSNKSAEYHKNVVWSKPPDPVHMVLERQRGDDLSFDLEQRARLRLSDEQKDAIDWDGPQPVEITGPAGAGKTLVLARRAARLALARTARTSQTFLVTAFNKDVVDLLANAFQDAIDEDDAPAACEWRAPLDDGKGVLVVKIGDRRTEVIFRNRDALGHLFNGAPDSETFPNFETEVAARRARLDPRSAAALKGLSDDFLVREYERFIVGRGCLTLDSYLALKRTGAGRDAALAEQVRRVIWDMLAEDPIPSHAETRRSLIRLGPRAVKRQVTHVFVDECQDFGEAELRLLGDICGRATLAIAGDPAQAIHLGATYRRPTFDGVKWERRELPASYRMPIRICEALAPIADEHEKTVADAHPLGAYKAGPLGVRPIVVEGERLSEFLGEIADAYEDVCGPPNAALVVRVHDCRDDAVRALRALGYAAQSADMKKAKGTERAFVVVSDRHPTAHAWAMRLDDDAVQRAELTVYTALARAVSILVIAIEKSSLYGCPHTRRLFGRLKEDRLLFWTEEASRRYRDCQNETDPRTLPVVRDLAQLADAGSVRRPRSQRSGRSR